jgi:hypothetical protein
MKAATVGHTASPAALEPCRQKQHATPAAQCVAIAGKNAATGWLTGAAEMKSPAGETGGAVARAASTRTCAQGA